MGKAYITPDAAMEFCRRNFPDEYEQFVEDMKKHPETLIMDFENIFTAIDDSYRSFLPSVIAKQRIDTLEEKSNLSWFIVVQNMRSHAVLKSLIEMYAEIGLEKFECFWILKQILSDPDSIFNLVDPLASAHWTVYKTREHTFPLPDSPVLVKKEGERNTNIMIALSPRMLIEIDLKTQTPQYSWTERNSVKRAKLNEYRKRCISNTFKEIIFNDEQVLRKWRSTREFKCRAELMSNLDSYNVLVAKAADGELWEVNAFGNLI